MTKRRWARGTGRAGTQEPRAALRAAPAGTDSPIARSAPPATAPLPGADASAPSTAQPSHGPGAGAAVDHTSGRVTPTARPGLVRQGSVPLRVAASPTTGGEPRTPVPAVVRRRTTLRAATD
ncbi:hypothetical protein [Streptomyces rubrolavendulae]|uniref:Uncharacterized protein n=1 Tax=Streptomyces rubrolavendulae TaxID=285473 RepID=A0A1D8GA79_9ACTN|nr:hypothetical protein [Streptomyces rubrolavendulae]AOT62366.1 hypothetical protein A4G23_05262 [Streptomyces rubrolavendulae]